MCTRVKNLVKRGISPQTGHTPKAETKKPAGSHYKPKKFSQELRKARSFREALKQYYNHRNLIQKEGA